MGRLLLYGGTGGAGGKGCWGGGEAFPMLLCRVGPDEKLLVHKLYSSFRASPLGIKEVSFKKQFKF